MSTTHKMPADRKKPQAKKKPSSTATPAVTGERRLSWSEIVEAAQQPPFIVQVTDDHEIRIEAPTVQQVQYAAQRGSEGDVEAVIYGLCGEGPGAELMTLLEHAPAQALVRLLEDVTRHFKIDYTLG